MSKLNTLNAIHHHPKRDTCVTSLVTKQYPDYMFFLSHLSTVLYLYFEFPLPRSLWPGQEHSNDEFESVRPQDSLPGLSWMCLMRRQHKTVCNINPMRTTCCQVKMNILPFIKPIREHVRQK